MSPGYQQKSSIYSEAGWVLGRLAVWEKAGVLSPLSAILIPMIILIPSSLRQVELKASL